MFSSRDTLVLALTCVQVHYREEIGLRYFLSSAVVLAHQTITDEKD